MKEKRVPLTIRLPEKRVQSIREMAEVFGCSASHLASVMLETGFILVDGVEQENAKKKSTAKSPKKRKAKNG